MLLIGLGGLVARGTGNQLVGEASFMLSGLGVVPLPVGIGLLGIVYAMIPGQPRIPRS